MRPFLLSMGDPAGIGPEITYKAWQALRSDPALTFAVIAPQAVFRAPPLTGATYQVIKTPDEASSVFAKALPVLDIAGTAAHAGQPSSNHAPAITRSISDAVTYCLSGEAQGLITNPISKSVLYEAGFKHPGHTEYLGELCKDVSAPYPSGPVMMLATSELRVGLVTIHMALREAIETLSTERIQHTAEVILGALKTDFGIKAPRLALTGLNPHAGEDGALGREEIDIINPVAQALRAKGHNVSDAQPADSLFHSDARKNYDAVLAMYHDQGLIPIKTLDFHGGVNITLGLPIIRTSPDHGTAFNIAGQGKARADSLVAAIRQAANMAHNRAQNHP